jgi:hypothetical protein
VKITISDAVSSRWQVDHAPYGCLELFNFNIKTLMIGGLPGGV